MALQIIGLAAGFMVVAMASYVRDLSQSVSELDDPRGESAMDAVLEEYSIAEIVALAIMADGELTEPELEALREITTTTLGDAREAERCIGTMRRQDRVAGDWDDLAELVRRSARRLSVPRRIEAYQHVVSLANTGSGLPGEAGYRTYRTADTQGMLDAMAAGLELDAEQQREAGRTVV